LSLEMGLGASELSIDVEGTDAWLVSHPGLGSPWAQFALRKYGVGFAATGVRECVALPRLLRRRLPDWNVEGCAVRVGADFVAFGRQLHSVSQNNAHLFYGVHIFFGNDLRRTRGFWYCGVREWHLKLNKAVLEPLPAPPQPSEMPQRIQRFPGRPRYLDDAPVPGAERTEVNGTDEAGSMEEAAEACKAAEGTEEVTDETVEHQLTLTFSNADGHFGMLSLPVPRGHLDGAAEAVESWAKLEIPLVWGGRRWRTAEDFKQLRESALNMPDLLLLGLETDLAMALTPDWTWERYPRGYGEAVLDLDLEEPLPNEEYPCP